MISSLPIHQRLEDHGATAMINLLILRAGSEKGLLVEIHGHQPTSIRVGWQVELTRLVVVTAIDYVREHLPAT